MIRTFPLLLTMLFIAACDERMNKTTQKPEQNPRAFNNGTSLNGTAANDTAFNDNKARDDQRALNDQRADALEGNDKFGNDRIGDDKLENGRVGDDKLENGRAGDDKFDDARAGNDKAGQDQLPDNTGKNTRDRGDNTLTPMDQGNSAVETAITAEIRKALMAESKLSFTAKNAKVTTVGSNVTLRGPVMNAAEKELIGAVARRASGVRNVDNQLEIKP